MKLSIIAAMTSDRVIGNDSGLPWDIPEEYQHYLRLVDSNPVIMGRKTFEIFGEDLDPENIIVVTSQKEFRGKHATNLRVAIEVAATMGDHAFIAGGRSLYEEALTVADEMHLSEIKEEHEGTVYFPRLDYDIWIEIEARDYPDFTYRKYVRK